MKNKFMRIAAVMLMLCLVTTCAISGTFAKYTTEKSGSDTARVAYWGFNVANAELTIDDLFDQYYDSATGTVISVDANGDGIKDDVIAPGTTSSADFKFQYTNYKTDKITAPEVAYTFVVGVNGSTDTAATNAILTNPNIKWKLSVTGNTDYAAPTGNIALGEWGTYAQLIANIEALDGNVTDNEYAAGTLPTAFNETEVWTISWQWIFDTEDSNTSPDVDEEAVQDKIDTDMGNAATLDEVKIAISITATQKD